VFCSVLFIIQVDGRWRLPRENTESNREGRHQNKMSVAPQEDSLKKERERLLAHMSTLQSRLREIDLILREGGENRAGEAPSPSATESPIKNPRRSIQLKAKALLDLVVKSEAPTEPMYLMRASEAARAVDARDNIAKLIGGPAVALTSAIARRPIIGTLLQYVWLLGFVIGLLSLIKVIPDWGALVSPLLTTPGLLFIIFRMGR
jgi:hypothetical protein